MGQAPPEASTHWLNTETLIFQLFTSVQMALKSSPKNEFNPEKIRGNELIRILLFDVLFMEKPVILASAFLIGEILKVFFYFFYR